MKILLSKGGTLERVVDVDSLEVPDLYLVSEVMDEAGLDVAADKVREGWHLALDMMMALRELAGLDNGGRVTR